MVRLGEGPNHGIRRGEAIAPIGRALARAGSTGPTFKPTGAGRHKGVPYGPSVEAAPLVSEVGELERDAVVAVLELGDDGLEVVPLLARHPDLITLDL